MILIIKKGLQVFVKTHLTSPSSVTCLRTTYPEMWDSIRWVGLKSATLHNAYDNIIDMHKYGLYGLYRKVGVLVSPYTACKLPRQLT